MTPSEKLVTISSTSLLIIVLPPIFLEHLLMALYGLICCTSGVLLSLAAEACDQSRREKP